MVPVGERLAPELVSSFLPKTIGQSREAAHAHTRGQVLPLNMRRADHFLDRVTADDFLARARAFRRAILAFVTLAARGIAIQLHQHGIIHVPTKRTFNRFKVCPWPDPGPGWPRGGV